MPQSRDAPADYLNWIPEVSAHEITHAILKAHSKPGFDKGEHVTDPDGDGVVLGQGDRNYLMVPGSIRKFGAGILFDDATRGEIDLTSKQSVER